MKLRELYIYGKEKLEAAEIEDANLDSKLLCYYVFELDAVSFFLNEKIEVSKEKEKLFKSLIKRRFMGEPLQYIIGRVEFMGFEFEVTPGVLIPRPETEIIVEKATEIIKNNYSETDEIKILDLCCGSGVIGLSLAMKIKNLVSKSTFHLSDISEDAIRISEVNRNIHNLKNVKIFQGDLLNAVEGNRYDMIISNPPYIPSDFIDTLQVEVKDHEPKLALDGGVDGLEPYRNIIPNLNNYLMPEGIVMFEIGHDQKNAVLNMLKETGIYRETHGITDLAGNDRIIWAKRYK